MDYANFVTPVGRLVAGDCYTGDKTDANGQPLTDKTGSPREEFYLALAIEKTNPEWEVFHRIITDKARADMPTQFGPDGNALRADFSWKITDGDSTVPNKKNTRPCDKEGYPGHWVVGLKSGFAPACYKVGEHRMPLAPNTIKRGDYIRIAGSVCGNGRTDSPGLYINHDMVELVAVGDAISNKPSATETFGGSSVGYVPAAAQQQAVGFQQQQQQQQQQAVGFQQQQQQPAHAWGQNAGAVELFMLNNQAKSRADLQAMGLTDDFINTLPRA